MNWFDVLKVQQRLFDEPSLTEEEEAILDEGLDENPFLRPRKGKVLPATEGHKKPKESKQLKLPGAPVRTKVPISEFRDDSRPTGDDTKLTVQQQTRLAQKEPRGHFKELANEMTRLALRSQNSAGQKQKKLLGRMRMRLEAENIPRA